MGEDGRAELKDEGMNALAKLDGATRALAEARTLEEVTHIRDIAEAARA